MAVLLERPFYPGYSPSVSWPAVVGAEVMEVMACGRPCSQPMRAELN